MRINKTFQSLFIVLIALVPYTLSALAQGDVFTETFDDPELPGWERSPNAIVTESVLRIEGEGFAFKPIGFENGVISMRLNLVSDGPIEVHYRRSDTDAYILRCSRDEIAIFKEVEGMASPLEATDIGLELGDWITVKIILAGGEHRIELNNVFILAALDDDPLPPGGLQLRVNGESVGEFDDIVVFFEGAAEQPPVETEISPTEEIEESPAQTSQPLLVSTLKWVYTGGPPGGLGYDIRYNFEQPDIWYVTDSFAGLFRSTDNGVTWEPSSTGITSRFGNTGDLIPIFSLTVDPINPNIVWAGTQNSGQIYKSVDYGKTWIEQDQGVTIAYAALHFRGFTIDPNSSDIVYAMAETTSANEKTGGQIYKTTNGGESWKLIWDGGMPSALTRYMWINPQNTDVLYVSTGIFDRGAVGPQPYSNLTSGLGILKSTDGGQTWRELNTANGLEMLHIGSLYMHPDNPDILLAAAGHILTGEEIMSVEQQGIRPSGIFRTTDGGETWEKVLAAAEFRPAEVFCSVEYCLSNPNIAYAASLDTVYRSEDAGVTWAPATREFEWGPPGVMAGFPIDIQCDPSNPDRLFINNYGGGNFLSEDSGQTWKNASQGYTGAQIISLAVDPTSPGRVFASGVQSGIWGTDDGGTTWVGLRPENVGVYQNGPGAIAIDPSNPNHLISGGRPGFVIFDSFNSGDDWGPLWSMHELGIESPLADGAVPSAIVFAPSDPQIVYLGGLVRAPVEPYTEGIGVFMSADNGRTWQQTQDNRMRDLSPYTIAVDPTDAQTVYAGTGDGVFKSTDGGESWRLLNIPFEQRRIFAVAVHPQDSEYLIAGVERMGAYISQDGGETWGAGIAGWEPNGIPTGIVFDPINPDIVFLSDFFSGVYRSEDGGHTWTKINNGLVVRSVSNLAISTDGAHLYAATDGAGVLRLDLNGVPPQSGTPLISTHAPFVGEGAAGEGEISAEGEPQPGEDEYSAPDEPDPEMVHLLEEEPASVGIPSVFLLGSITLLLLVAALVGFLVRKQRRQ
ncbi:MAG: hypothetical protein OEV06_01865 [Anaerolineae bacterium]|nr:hypothetical protein [Anaerolineae bacterium]